MDVVHAASCLNCGAPITGAFCASCGQKQAHVDLTLREFFHETTHELLHWDGKIPATLKTLFFHPGRLTRDFLAGRRARWLPPLRVYLLCSLAFFVTGPIVESITHQPVGQVARFKITRSRGDNAPLTADERQELAEGLPARVFGLDRMERAAADNERLNHIIQSSFPKAMFVLLPVFALITKLAWRRAMPHYPAHLYLALHIHAVWFGALALVTLATLVLVWNLLRSLAGTAALFYVVIYTLLTLRRVFGESWTKTIAKSTAVAFAYAFCLLAVSLGMMAYALIRI
jgi:hypothetical protein